MKRTLFLLTLIFSILSFTAIVGCNNQTPTKGKSSVPENKNAKVEYELSEKCGKRCEEMFKKEYGNGYKTDKDGNWMYGYQNHYNKKLNKCFILVTSTHYPNDKKYGVFSTKEVFDVNENKSYGTFSMYSKNVTGMECKLLEKTCQSGEEWDLLVKPYMEE